MQIGWSSSVFQFSALIVSCRAATFQENETRVEGSEVTTVLGYIKDVFRCRNSFNLTVRAIPLRRKKFRVNSFKKASLASGHELFKTLPKEIFLNPKLSIQIFPFDVKNNRQRWDRIELNALRRDYLSLFSVPLSVA